MMSKGCMVGLGILGIVFLATLMIAGAFMSANNREVALRTAIVAKQKDNTSEFDNMWKKISGVAQVSTKQMESLKEIFKEHAAARSTGGDNQVMTWVKESIPNVDTTTFNNIQNIIVASRDSWTMRQKELMDLSREHEKMLGTAPDCFFLWILGRKSIPVTLVTSSRTEKAFESGKDDDTKVF